MWKKGPTSGATIECFRPRVEPRHREIDLCPRSTDAILMKTILVPLDFSDITGRVVELAQQFAAAFQSRIIFLHVAEPEPDFVGFEPAPVAVPKSSPRDLSIKQRELDVLKAHCSTSDALALQVEGPAISSILEAAKTHRATLIILGSHGHGALYELLVGSVTAGVLKGASCPVLVVPSENVATPRS